MTQISIASFFTFHSNGAQLISGWKPLKILSIPQAIYLFVSKKYQLKFSSNKTSTEFQTQNF